MPLLRRLLLCILAATASTVIHGRETDDFESALAKVWLERAAEVLEEYPQNSDALGEAADACDAAREYAAGGPDLLFIEAELLLAGYDGRDAGDSPVRIAYEKAGLSLERSGVSDFRISDFRSRAVLWSSLALRLGEYRALVDRSREWPKGEADDPVLLYAAARACQYLGLESEAAELASRGEALTDSGTDLGELGVDFGPPMPAFRALAMAAGDQEALGSVEAASRRWPGLSNALLPWILSGRYAPADSQALKSALNEEYRPLLEALRDGTAPAVRPPEPLRRDLALARRLGLDLSEFYADFTGSVSADADYDGYPEEWIRIVNGRVDSRKIDFDQDGRYEWEFDYGAGGPLRIGYDQGSVALHYERGSYPELLSLIARDGESTTVVSFNPGAFSWDPTDGNPAWGSPMEPDWREAEFWRSVRNVSVDAEVAEGTVHATTVLSRGYPVRAVEYGFTGEDDANPVWVRQILYEDGVPFAGRRSFRRDAAGERIWELYERYERGIMVGLAWDPGMTGTPAYMRDWALERYLEVQAWDTDSDGWMDARRFVLPNGEESASDLLITEARAEDLLPWQASDWAPWDR